MVIVAPQGNVVKGVFHVTDRERAEVEHAGGQHRVGFSVADGRHKGLQRPAAARGNDRTETRRLISESSAVSKPSRVPSRSWEVTRSSPAPRRTASWAHATASMPASSRPPRTSTVQPSPLRRASMAQTTLAEPSSRVMASNNGGSAMAAELTDTLSAPASSSVLRPRRCGPRRRW